MSSLKLSSYDFQPLPPSEAVQQISRPSLSYWADAWRRLRENPRAMASLGLITFLLAFVSIGPALWPVDPSAQDLDQIGIGPALIVPSPSPHLSRLGALNNNLSP